jgi:hypothetical protein
MNRSTRFFWLLLLFFSTTSVDAEAPPGMAPASKSLKSVPVYAAKLIPAKPNELVSAEIGKGRYIVVAYSRRKGKGENAPLESDVLVFEKKSGLPKLIWRAGTKEELYEPVIYSPLEWKMQGQPLVVVTRQAGAAATVADVISFNDKGAVKQVNRTYAERIDISKVEKSGAPQMVVYERGETTSTYVPKVFNWTGNQFSNDSKKYPEFFANYLEELNYKTMLDPDYPIQDREQIVQMLSLAGRKDEAKAVLVDLLKEVNAAPTIELKVVGRIRSAIEQLDAGGAK